MHDGIQRQFVLFGEARGALMEFDGDSNVEAAFVRGIGFPAIALAVGNVLVHGFLEVFLE
ncbi:MAG: hypothetical protein ABI147_03415 [Acidobacteriaceae bacterium]